VSAGFQTVHVRVNDAATGKPTPVRIRFVGTDGTYYAPFGRLAEFSTEFGQDVGGNVLVGEKKFAYINGTCEIRLPIGMVDVEIRKGLEYRPVHQRVELKQGKLSLRLEIHRWIDARMQGWYSGDTHCFNLSPHSALLEAQAEDLAVVNLLAYQGAQRISPNIDAFSGQEPALQAANHMVVVNTFNGHGALGSLALLNCHRVVYPLALVMESEALEWNLADWCEQCHRKGGLVVATHFRDELGHLPSENAVEIMADLILGLVDAIAVRADPRCSPSGLAIAADLWDAGLRFSLVGGSAKDSNGQVLGCPRTYVQLEPGAEFSYKNWIEAVRAGRTFVTNEPLLFLQVNGQPPGSTVDQPEVGKPVHVRLEAKSVYPFEGVEVYFKDRTIARAVSTKQGESHSATIDIEFPIHEPGWIVAECSSGLDHPQRVQIGAATTPIQITLGGKSHQPTTRTLQGLSEYLDRVLNWVMKFYPFETDQQRQRMANVYLQAKQKLQEKLRDAENSPSTSS
jgi:hypothetical protein